MIEMRLMMTRRSAPATSAPRLKASLTTARKREQEQRHGERADGQHQSNLLAKEIGEDQSSGISCGTSCQRALAATGCLRPARLFRGAASMSARSATTGSCVTISTVLLYSLHQAQ